MIYLNLDVTNKWQNPTREDICSFISDEIFKFYGITHEVDFEKITRNKYTPAIILQYEFDGEHSEDSLCEYVYRISNMDQSQTATNITYTTSDPQFIELLGNSNFKDLDELQTLYIGMKYYQSRVAKNDEWDVVKFILKKKLSRVFKGRKDGTFHEVEAVKFKLQKLLQFNQPKYEFVNRRVKRLGKTLTNFAEASMEWDKANKTKLNLDRSKASMELRTDLAMSGLEDDLV